MALSASDATTNLEFAPKPPQTFVSFQRGSTLAGRYRIHEPVGAGGMGSVFRAFDLVLNCDVAIKVLDPALVSDPRMVERFKREILTARTISHPHVARIHDIGQHEGAWFISMEFLSGGTLSEWLAANPTGELETCLKVSSQIVEGVCAIHAAGIVHRDLKPHNILFDAEGRPKIADFGLALPAQRSEQKTEIMGTPHYMSPEQCNGEEPTLASDVYSLGIVLYELFAGVLPFRADSWERLARLHTSGARPELNDVRGGVPVRVKKIVRRCLSKSVSLRFESALQLREAYQGALDDIVRISVSGIATLECRSDRRKKRVLRVATVALAIMTVLIMVRGTNPDPATAIYALKSATPDTLHGRLVSSRLTGAFYRLEVGPPISYGLRAELKRAIRNYDDLTPADANRVMRRIEVDLGRLPNDAMVTHVWESLNVDGLCQGGARKLTCTSWELVRQSALERGDAARARQAADVFGKLGVFADAGQLTTRELRSLREVLAGALSDEILVPGEEKAILGQGRRMLRRAVASVRESPPTSFSSLHSDDEVGTALAHGYPIRMGSREVQTLSAMYSAYAADAERQGLVKPQALLNQLRARHASHQDIPKSTLRRLGVIVAMANADGTLTDPESRALGFLVDRVFGMQELPHGVMPGAASTRATVERASHGVWRAYVLAGDLEAADDWIATKQNLDVAATPAPQTERLEDMLEAWYRNGYTSQEAKDARQLITMR